MSAIATERLSLLPWEAEHVELLCRLGSIPEVMTFIGPGELWSAQRSQEVSDIAVAHWAKHGFGWRVAVERATGREIGFIGLNFAGEGTAGLSADEFEIGWWMDPGVWSHGFAREGGSAIRDEAFNRLNAPSVIARIQPANRASIAVAESIGLTHSFETTGKYGEPLSVYRLDAARANDATCIHGHRVVLRKATDADLEGLVDSQVDRECVDISVDLARKIRSAASSHSPGSQPRPRLPAASSSLTHPRT